MRRLRVLVVEDEELARERLVRLIATSAAQRAPSMLASGGEPPTPDARAKMLQAEDVAACVWLAISLPPRAVVEEILIRPR